MPGGARARGGAAVAGLPGDDAGLLAAVGVLVEGAVVLDGAALAEVVPDDLDGVRLDLDLVAFVPSRCLLQYWVV